MSNYQYEEICKEFNKLLHERTRELDNEAQTRFELIWENTLDELKRSIQQKEVNKALVCRLRLDFLCKVRDKLGFNKNKGSVQIAGGY